MNRILIAFIGSVLLFAAFAYVLFREGQPASVDGERPIMLFCAASNRAVMEAIRADYENEFHRRVEIQYGPSQTLLSSIEVSKSGDLYLPADDSYLTMATDKALVEEILPIARMQGVIAVQTGNPKSIESLSDLVGSDIQFVQANPDAAAIGKLARKVLGEAGNWVKVDKATTAYHTTVTDVARDIEVGAADAGIVFDAVLHTFDNVEYVELPDLKDVAAQISIGVISSTKNSQAALHFARYVSAKDRGLKRYKEFGFRVEGGDQWSDSPELEVYAGSMLRPAIEDTIAQFQEREGVTVNCIYNGCGILVGQMKTGAVPDAYFACDLEFMNQVQDLFLEPTSVSQNELVILVQKGNPHNIASLRDLTKDNLRVGIGHAKQCAMGWITQNTFREGGLHKEIMANVDTEVPTGDLLVNQIRAGSLDAAVAYLSNAAGSAEFLDAVKIRGIKCSTATQPWAVAAQSKYPETAGRLFQQICSAESKETFAAEGFRWKAE